MEKEKFFTNEGNGIPQAWNSIFGLGIQGSELNCSSEQLPNCFFNPNCENSMDQRDFFESALSSIVSSPANSHPGIQIPGGGGESIVLRELIGRLGSICISGEISPQSRINSRTNSCYTTPLNSPPKLNLSITDHQIDGNLPIPGNHQLPPAPFPTDAGFVERAARYSSFGGKNFVLKEGEFPQVMESGKLSRVSSSQSFKTAGSQFNVIPDENKKFSRLSMFSTQEDTELGDSMEESSVFEQIPGGETETGIKVQSTSTTGRKRNGIPKGKGKETQSSTTISAKDDKVVAEAEKEESDAKRSKSDEEEKVKEKTEGNQKQTKENAKPPEPPKDYIHVKARRGQATDSHSLAERVRREKINERMKFLQDLVPGCNKVTGKVVMLDEIINYVQSLQRQVEFLSMKLAEGNQKQTKENAKPPEPPKDYIHVKARRGQATDSHSLAKRVRREKISERMKFLQDLVPGCNKVFGSKMVDKLTKARKSNVHEKETKLELNGSINEGTRRKTRLSYGMSIFVGKSSEKCTLLYTNPQQHLMSKL